ncbi:sensor histidine kinase [Catellatospora sp. TT07R-123]|uniref:sensor histidine kinase n=1 Tax=Catellatospora sp. TT07R-123 TaxID=2733863 RepID=UPI0035B54C9F
MRVALPGWVAAPLTLGVLAVIGYGWSTRRRYARSLRDRAKLLDEAGAAAVAAAVDAERDRIARELHDIVSHNVSLMVIQAGAARQVAVGAPQDAIDALLAVESSGREAMTELRALLGLLTPDGSGEDDLLPQPGMSRLDELVDRVAFAGLPVELTVEGQPRPLPPGLDLTAYRVIQEALTNALKHAPGAHAKVNVRYTDRWLRIEALNSGPSVLTGQAPAAPPVSAPSDGRGLLGLRERVAVFGGQLDARRRLGGGFRVRVRIPL